MIFVSLTRLRLRSVRFLPLFAIYTLRALRQVRAAHGFEQGSLLPDRKRTFWTMTAWRCEEDMRRYMTAGAHHAAMPHLLHWCDEASVAHWVQPDLPLPTWAEAARLMRDKGRPSKVRHPSPQHATLSFDTPRTDRSAPIRRPASQRTSAPSRYEDVSR